MVTDKLYKSGSIPGNFLEVWYDAVAGWYDAFLDNQLARKVVYLNTDVAPTADEYERISSDFAGKDVIPRAKNAPGSEVSIGASGDSAKIWRWPDYFTISEDDMDKRPELYNQYVKACMDKIFRGEDKAFINGVTVNNITGLLTAARANSNGKIAATGGTYNNIGAWLTTDTNRDIYEDLRVARGLLDSKFRARLSDLFLVGNSDSLDALAQKDPYSDSSTTVAESVCGLFGRAKTAPVDSWAIRNDQLADDYVYIVCKSRQAAELVQARAITIDSDYTRVPIGNREVHIYQDVGMIFHSDNAFVEIQIS